MNNIVVCDLCPHYCQLAEGQKGFCGVRQGHKGKILALTYGKVSSLALDPIEKKPLSYFHPGSNILSVGSVGCNMACPFCQNYEIAKAQVDSLKLYKFSPEDLVNLALDCRGRGNIGLAFTYNEPLVNYNFVLDTAKLARARGLETVLVTNGQINKPYLKELLPWIRAWNIDLKCFSEEGYKKLGGDLASTLSTIEAATPVSHVEVTTLVVPGISDKLEEFQAELDFLSQLKPQPVLHLTRYFPRYHYQKPATSKALLVKMAQLAQTKLDRVELGNI